MNHHWQPIASAPKDRWIYIWSSSTFKNWKGECPYQPDLGKWDGVECFITSDGSRIKGGSHWCELFLSPENDAPQGEINNLLQEMGRIDLLEALHELKARRLQAQTELPFVREIIVQAYKFLYTDIKPNPFGNKLADNFAFDLGQALGIISSIIRETRNIKTPFNPILTIDPTLLSIEDIETLEEIAKHHHDLNQLGISIRLYTVANRIENTLDNKK